MFNNKKNEIDALNACLKERRDTITRQKEQLAELQAENDALQDDAVRRRKEIEEVKYTWGAENEELAKKLAEAEKRLKDAEEQNSKKPEQTETPSGNRCEIEDTTGYSAKEIDAMHLRQALRILDEGGFVPQDKKGDIWNKAYILCLITEKGSQTYAAGTVDEYRSMLGGLFAAAKQNKELEKALLCVTVLDMLQRKLSGADKAKEGDQE